jgi:hypothetical protein
MEAWAEQAALADRAGKYKRLQLQGSRGALLSCCRPPNKGHSG